jgi:hypothetical protein
MLLHTVKAAPGWTNRMKVTMPVPSEKPLMAPSLALMSEAEYFSQPSLFLEYNSCKPALALVTMIPSLLIFKALT